MVLKRIELIFKTMVHFMLKETIKGTRLFRMYCLFITVHRFRKINK